MTDIKDCNLVTILYVYLLRMEQEQYMFLRAQVKAFHPNWNDEQVNEECKKILAGEYSENDDSCLYCGS